jgi:hypothetical protein
MYVATEMWHQNRDLLQLCDATPGGEAALDGAGDGAGLPGHGGSVVQHDRALRLEATTSGSVPGVRSGYGGWSPFWESVWAGTYRQNLTRSSKTVKL